MLSFHAENWFESRRGRCAVIPKMPEEYLRHYWNPTHLTNQQVEIDGKVYEIAGVETFAIMRSKDYPYRQAFSLLVKES